MATHIFTKVPNQEIINQRAADVLLIIKTKNGDKDSFYESLLLVQNNFKGEGSYKSEFYETFGK